MLVPAPFMLALQVFMLYPAGVSGAQHASASPVQAGTHGFYALQTPHQQVFQVPCLMSLVPLVWAAVALVPAPVMQFLTCRVVSQSLMRLRPSLSCPSGRGKRFLMEMFDDFAVSIRPQLSVVLLLFVTCQL